MKIVTVSDTFFCDAKPTKYCAIVENDRDVDELQLHLRKGLEACGVTAEDIERWGRDVDEAWCNAQDRGYGWLVERFLVEITDVDAPWQSYRSALMFELALKCIEDGMISVSERASLPEMHRGWAEETIKDALRCALEKEMKNEHS